MAKTAQKLWAEVDSYFSDLFVPADKALDAAVAANRAADLPPIDVTPLQGQFLDLLVRMSGARRVLEIGTLGGYSTLWLARALPEDGRVVTLELEPHHAKVARANLKRAGALDRVDIRVGRASDSLRALVDSGAAPFDLVFIDADKAGYPEYLDWSLQLARPGTVIVADNVVRDGKVIDPKTRDANVRGVQRFAALVAAEPRLRATVLQTVGSKGYDGFAIAIVLSGSPAS